MNRVSDYYLNTDKVHEVFLLETQRYCVYNLTGIRKQTMETPQLIGAGYFLPIYPLFKFLKIYFVSHIIQSIAKMIVD